VASGGRVLLLGESSLATADGGATWEPPGIDGMLVGTDQGWFLGVRDGRLAVRDPTAAWHALPWSHEAARPLTLLVHGDNVRVLTSDRPEVARLHWFESNDRGQTWDAGSVRAVTHHRSWALSPDGAVFAFSPGHLHLRVRGP